MGDYWQLTIDVLQSEQNPIVDKPKLQEKYLTKPPFRYLHDIITAVQSNTGFAPGLYSGEELDAKAIQDKDAKVNYLQKIIDVVGLVLGQHVPAKPLKIVAGLEPENTNIFLQMMAAACRMNNGADAVQRVLAGEHQAAPGAAAAGSATAAAPERPTSRPSSQQRGRPDEEAAAPVEPPARPSPSRSKRQSDTKAEEPPPAAAPAKPSKSKESKAKTAPPPVEEPPAAPPPAARELQKSLSKSRKQDDAPPPVGSAGSADASGDDPMRRTLMRPQSARKAPPKPAALATPSTPTGGAGSALEGRRGAGGAAGDRPLGAAPTTPGSARPVRVMEEGAGGASDDDVEVVHEAVPVAIGANRDAGGERGVLVKNIMDAEKNLKKAGEEAAAGAAGADGSAGGTGIILGKRIGKAAAAAGGAGAAGAGVPVRTTDTAAIKDMVQKLCQSSHPLAKSMDYLSEDLENMAKEYRFWQVEKRMFADKLAGEQRLLGDSVAAETQLADLDGQVRQVRDRILGIKAQLLRNDETIDKLLSMAVGR